MRNIKIVVLHKGNMTAKCGIDRMAENILQVLFTTVIRWVGFARKHNLNGASKRRQDASQSLRVIKDQFRTLVIGKSPGESNGERCWIQQRTCRHDPSSRHLLLCPQLPGALSNKRDEVASQRLANSPQFLVRDVRDFIPKVHHIVFVLPLYPEITFY